MVAMRQAARNLQSTLYTRRKFAKLMLMGSVAPVVLNNISGLADTASAEQVFISATATNENQYAIAGFDIKGKICFQLAIDERGHGVALHSTKPGLAVVFARRPGTSFHVVDYAKGRLLEQHNSTEGRHLFGHGVFSEQGSLLYTTENDNSSGEGVVGVRDAKTFKWLGEFPTYGVGPHELALMPDGKTLVVCNGGILTNPETARQKLNIFSMEPSLVYINTTNGKLISRHTIQDNSLSIRHLSIHPNGLVAISMQYEGAQNTLVPLIGLHDGHGPIKLIQPDESVLRSMRQYAGQITINPSSGIAAVACPKGNVVTFWDVNSQEYAGSISLPDAGGIGLALNNQYFIISSGGGGVYRTDSELPKEADSISQFTDIHWDNHVAGATISRA